MNSLRIFRYGLVLGFQDFKVFWSSWRMWFMTHIVRVTTSAITLILLGRLLKSEEVVHFILIGQIVMVGPQYVGWTVAAFTWDRMFRGTYPMLIAAPTSLVPVMLGRTAIWLLNGIATSLVTLAVLVPIFGIPISPFYVLPILLIIVLLCASSYGLAFCLGSLVNWVPRLRNVVHMSSPL